MKRILTLFLCFVSIVPIIMADEKEDSLIYYSRQAREAYLSKNFDGACRNIEQLLIVYNHPPKDLSRDTIYANIMSLYASCIAHTWNYEEAIDAITEATNIYESVYGSISPRYATSLTHFAQYQSLAGHHQEALQLSEKATNIFRIVLGPKHIFYLTSLVSLAKYHSDLKNYNEAFRLGTQAISIFETTGETNRIEYAISISNLAYYYLNCEDFDEAIKSANKAIGVFNKIGETNNSEYAKALSNLAQCYLELHNYDEAITFGTEAINIFKKTGEINSSEYAAALNNLALCYSSLKKYDEAIRFGNEVLIIYQNVLGPKNFYNAITLCNLSQCYLGLESYEKAIQLGTDAICILKDTGKTNHPEYAAFLASLASCHVKLGNYEDAIRLGTEAIDAFKNIGKTNSTEYALTLYLLAQSYMSSRNYETAVRLGTEAIEIYNNLGETDSPEYVLTLSIVAQCYKSFGNYNEAIRLINKAIGITKSISESEDIEYASLLNNLSICYSDIGNYNDAIRLSLEALEILKNNSASNTLSYSTTLTNLSTIYVKLGNYRMALKYASEAEHITMSHLGKESLEYVMDLNNLASCYANLGNYNEAIKIDLDAIKTLENVNAKYTNEYITIFSNLANYYSKAGKYNEAIQSGLTAMEISNIVWGQQHPDKIVILINLSICYAYLKNYDEAIRLGSEAIYLYYNLIDKNRPAGYEVSIFNLAGFYSDIGNYNKAIPLLSEYISNVQKKITTTLWGLPTDERKMYWDNYSYLLNQRIPSIIAHSGISNAASMLYDNTALFAKGLLLFTELEMTKLIQESGDTEAFQMYSELHHLRQILNTQYSKPVGKRHLDCDSLELVSSALERQLNSRVKEFGDYTRNLNITWQDVQNKLEDNDIAIEFLSYPENNTITYAALSLCKNDSAPELTILFNESQLQIAKNVENTYQNQLTDGLVWGHLSSRLVGKSQVYFSASGMLHNIGIEYLPSMEGKDCYRLSSTRELVTHKLSPSINDATIFGGINYNATYASIKNSEPEYVKDYFAMHTDSRMKGGNSDYRSFLRYGVGPLPGSHAELQEISAMLKDQHVDCDTLSGNEASEESFKALSGHHKSLLHISTHGFYYSPEETENLNEHLQRMLIGDNRPTHYEDQSLLRSWLCFAGANLAICDTLPDESRPVAGQDDGILNALEIAQMDLRGLDMVVLSACQTALGDVVNGEGVFGLQRGFKKAGAQSILMSLWEVDDDVTQLLMTEFYRGWTSGMTKTAALRNAQAIVKQKYPDPQHWAAFILLDALD